MFSEQHRAPEGLNLPGGDGDQKSGSDIDDRMRIGIILEDQKQKSRKRQTRDDRHQAKHGVCFDMLFGRSYLFGFLFEIRQKTSALATVSFGRLVGFSAFWTVHNSGQWLVVSC